MADRRCYHIILTGASGYLGQHLLHAFMTTSFNDTDVQNNNNNDYYYHIHALYGGNTPGFVEAVQRHADVHTIENRCVVQVEALDLTDTSAVQEWIMTKEKSCFSNRNSNNSFVCIIHAAALSNPRACQKDAARAHALNVPKVFFDACHRSLSGMFGDRISMISLSTDQVYCGTCPPYMEEAYDETATSCRRPLPVSVYGATKLAMEEYLMEIFQKYTTTTTTRAKLVVLRSSIILGRKAPILPEHAHDTFLHFCASRKGMDTDFYTDERRSVVSIDDVIASIQWFVRDACCLKQQHQVSSPPPPISSGNTTTDASSTTTKDIGIASTTGSMMILNMGGPTSVSRFEMAKAVFEHLGYDLIHLIAKEKQQLDVQDQVPSPLDISMNSTKIENITGRTFESLAAMVEKTFSQKHTT